MHSSVYRASNDSAGEAKDDVLLAEDVDASQVLDVPPEANGVRLEEHQLTLRDLFVKDAFLIFRALCKKSREPLSVER
jgi:brefeldin A-inhibited guanine nucleotide-exchange protein